MTWNKLSLLSRLTATLAIWVVAGFVAGYFILSTVFAIYVDKQFYEELKIHVNELRRLTVENGTDDLKLAGAFSDPRYDDVDSGYYWQVRINSDVALYSPSLAGRSLEIPKDDMATNTIPHRHEVAGPTGKLLILENVVPKGPGRELRFIVGMDQSLFKKQVREFNFILGASLLIFGSALVIAAYFLIKLGLGPLDVLTGKLRRLRAGEIEKLSGEYPSEISPLVGELNDLIVNARENLQRARGQAGRLAHGLKTPLAVVADEAYRLGEQGQAEAAKTIAEQCRTMQIQIDQHIARARASATASLPGVKSSVLNVASSVTNALSRLHVASGIEIELAISGVDTVAVDAQDLGEILGCVIDNAFKHAESRVRVTSFADNEQTIELRIEDDGTGLPPESREYVFQSGARVNENVDGSGLGLAILKEIVELYRGHCLFSDSDLGGAMLSIWLPRA